MARLLHVSVSPRDATSFSRRIARELITALHMANPNLVVIERDLAASPVPHPDAAFVAASLMPDAEFGDPEHRALVLSETLIAELELADVILMSTPMHNFTVPSALKAWLDHVVRPGRTFRTTSTGKVGLLERRPVYVIVACGGRFGAEPGTQTDFFSPYLRYVLGTIGLSNVEVLRVEELNRGPHKVAHGFEVARRWIEMQTAGVRETYWTTP